MIIYEHEIQEEEYLDENFIVFQENSNEQEEEERKFVCDFYNCRKSFKRKQHLKNHKLTHINLDDRMKFTCDLCKKQFLSASTLKDHKECVHDKVSYNVNFNIFVYCNLSFCFILDSKLHLRIMFETVF